MKTIDKHQVIQMHSMLLASTGGTEGLRDEALLESALASARQTFIGMDLYPTTISKIARITFSLIQNHPFVDGNKRIGVFVMLTLLALNNIEVSFSNNDVVRIGLEIAAGRMSHNDLIEQIEK